MTKFDDRRVCWLASYPKSGNTWIRALISAYQRGGEVDINGLTHSTGDHHEMFYKHVSPAPLELLTELEVNCLRYTAIVHMMRVLKFDPFVCKTHNVCGSFSGIPLFPEGLTQCAIYVVRDPRDIALSYARHFSRDVDAAIAAMNSSTNCIIRHEDSMPGFVHYLSDWSSHVKSWLNAPFAVYIVRYEDLLAKPVVILRRVLEFMGVEPRKEDVAQAVDACAFAKLQAQEVVKGFDERKGKDAFFHSGGSTWQQVLTEQQVANIEHAHCGMMDELRYRTSTKTLRNIA